MYRILLLLSLSTLSSCFLFRPYRDAEFRYTENGGEQRIPLVVPKRYGRSESVTDSSGNQVLVFHYGSSKLYFARMIDTSRPVQAIYYPDNLPKQYLDVLFYKGIDSSGQYWRESRIPGFRSGYYRVEEGRDGLFDSSLNHFSLRARTQR
jgi:hypothetical protein